MKIFKKDFIFRLQYGNMYPVSHEYYMEQNPMKCVFSDMKGWMNP